ncbi:uncharacterized protein A4U43_C05F27910 [Asparagus officinalis]|uniref:Uncharacterized protein n=1 Tax=Asparagus officinalis TaxID=4686 RepID=A0A5P1EZB3_ASPOF|nr:allergen MAG29-like [Asparagus officinalis]ONK69889.1 uncharacterized protein A4U43_C05F27910 [Asparagus officinalis]
MTGTGVEFDAEVTAIRSAMVNELNGGGLGDRERIEETVEEAIWWLEGNQLAEVEEFEHKQNELEEVCVPLIAKMCQGGGGADSVGMNSGGASGGGAGGSGGGGSGPKIEEVD